MVFGSMLVSGIVIIVGSALFLCAAFTPISFRVFPEKSATRKLEAIRASPTAWLVTQILFGLGALVTASVSVCLPTLYVGNRRRGLSG